MQLVGLLVAVLAVHSSSADGDSLSLESLAGYKIDPKAPCGTRCQIKRAVGAWGDMLQVKMGSLVSQYSRMSVDRKALRALKAASLGFQKRVDAAERAQLSGDTPQLKRAFKHLKQIDTKAKALVQSIKVQGVAANRDTALKAAKLIDAERKALNKYELRATDVRAMQALATSAARLSNQVKALSEEQLVSSSATLSKAVNRLLKACAQASTQIGHSEMSGSRSSHKLRQELESRVDLLRSSYSKHYQQVTGQQAKRQLEHQVELMAQRKARIEQNFDPHQAGQQAVLHEVIAKAHHRIVKLMKAFSPTGGASDKETIEQVLALLRHEHRNIQRFDQLHSKLQLSSSMVTTVTKLQKQVQAVDSSSLDQNLNKLKRDNQGLQQAVASLNGTSDGSPAQLGHDIEQLLHRAEQQRLNHRKQLKVLQTQNRGLAVAEKQLNHVNAETKQLHHGLSDLLTKSRKHTKMDSKLRQAKPYHQSDSVSQLESEIDGFLDAAASTDKNDNPYLLESALSSTLLDPVDMVQLSEASSEWVPFLSDAESARIFNEHKTKASAVPRAKNTARLKKHKKHASAKSRKKHTTKRVEPTREQNHQMGHNDFVQAVKAVMAPHRG